MLLVGALLLAVFVLPSPWGAVAVVAAFALELAEAWFWWRLSRRRAPVVGAESMVGATATVATALRPDGQVRIRGELWRARCAEGADAGAPVTVVGVEGLTLVVERA